MKPNQTLRYSMLSFCPLLLLVFPALALTAWLVISVSAGMNAREFKQYEDDEHEIN